MRAICLMTPFRCVYPWKLVYRTSCRGMERHCPLWVTTVDEEVDVAAIAHPGSGHNALGKDIQAGLTPVLNRVERIVVHPVQACDCIPRLDITLLHDRGRDHACLDLLEHVVVAIHSDDLDLAGLTGLLHGLSRAQAAVAV